MSTPLARVGLVSAALIALSSICASVGATPLPAAASEQLQRAEKDYDNYEYARSAAKLKGLLSDPPTNAKVRQRARLMLAFSHLWLRDETAAKSDLQELFRENPDYPLERELHHPDLVKFYDREHTQYVAQAPVAHPAPGTALEAAPRTPVQTAGDRHPWLRIFPLGIGQFVNHDSVGGGLFLGVELGLIGANVAGALWRSSLKSGGGYKSGAVAAQIVQDGGGIGAIVVAVIGIVDAFVWSPARGRKSLEAASALTLDLGPVGLYTFTFAPAY